IESNITTIRLEHLIIRDIKLHFIQKNKEFNEKMKNENYAFSSQSIYLNYMTRVFYHSIYIYSNIFTKLCPTIVNLELHFIDSTNISTSSSTITLSYNEIVILFAFTAISFFDAQNIDLYLPS